MRRSTRRRNQRHSTARNKHRRRLTLEFLEPRVVLATTYAITEIAPLPGMDLAVANDINNNGELVGTSSRTGLVPQSRAFKWDASGGTQDLGTLGGTDAWGVAINDAGQITGVALDADGKQDGFRHDPGVGMFDIGGLGSNAGVYPRDINAAGDVVGGSFYFGMQVGFLYTDAAGIQINTPATNTAARTTQAINDNGDVAIFSSARSWITGTGGGWIDGAYPTALNNALVATGSTDPFGNGGELWRYSPANGNETLGQLSPGGHTIGRDVNESGVIVGQADLADGSSHALIYTDADGLLDLNDLISPDSGWLLTAANGLNDSGQIVGTGLVGGQQHAFLLTPFSGADADPPLATLDASPVTRGNEAAFDFSVAYWDRSGVDVASLGNTDLTVTAPDGSTHAAALIGFVASNPLRPVATYRVTRPVGVLGAKDNGTWTVAINAGEVADLNGDAAAADEIGTVEVAIVHEVTAVVSGPGIAQASLAATFTLTAATTWSYDAAEVFDFAIDWDGDGTADQTVSGLTGTAVDHAFDAAGDYTIRVVAADAHGGSSPEATTDIAVTAAPGYQVWEFAPALPGTYRSGAAGVNYGGQLYLIGGAPYANGGEEGAVNALPAGASSWVAQPHLDEGNPLADVGAGVDGQGRLIYFGGTLSGAASTSTYFYSSGKGDQLASKNFAVTQFAFTTDGDGRLYSIGGNGATGSATTYFERYDALADTWTELPPLPQARSHAAAAYDGAGHILVMGGLDAAGVRQSTVFSYDLAADSWSLTVHLPLAVSDGAAALGADGLVYFTGGQTSSGPSDGLYIYNPAGGSWITGPTMPTPRSDHAVAVGDDGFLYVIGGAATNSVEKIDTNATSQIPVANDDNIVTTEDQAVTFDVRTNDTDADGDPLHVASFDTAGTTGHVVLNADGTLTYMPRADFTGTDSFTHRVSDPGGLLDEATVTITVSPDGLAAGNDAAATNEDTALSILVGDLLSNDSSANVGANLSVAAVDTVSSQGAAVTLNADGSVTYDPSTSSLLQRLGTGDVVTDLFHYTLVDGTGPSESATVSITVVGLNDDPIANDDVAVVGYKLETVDYPGASSTSIVGLNNLGLVVGTYSDATGGHIFTYDGTAFTQIDDDIQLLLDAQGITSSIAPHGINDAGVIVGGIAGTSNVVGFTGAKGFIYDGTNLLPVEYSVRDSSLADVNNNGLAVGSYASPAGYTTTAFGFTYDNGQVGSFTHPDHTYLRGTWLTDATDTGVLVGNYYPDFYSSSRGFVFDGTTFTDVLVPGTNWGYTTGINNAGTIIGTQIHQNGADRYGFVFDGANYESFQYPGWSGWTTLDDINDAGVLAGSAAGHGFIARPATSTDKDTIFIGRAASTLGNDHEIDFNDSLAAAAETVTSARGATARILADGRFEYDPTGSAELQALGDGASVIDTFTYTLVDSQGGSDTATVSISVFGTGAAGTPPSAALTAGAVTAGAADHTFSVRYTDDTAIDVATIDGNDVRVTGPNGYDAAAALVGIDDPTNGTPRLATYQIAAPGGSWNGADNGTYTVVMQADEVLDVDGNAAGAVPLGTFHVAIDAAPTLVISGVSFAAVGEPVVLTLAATSSFPSDPADVFTFDVDWENDGTYDERISGPTGTQASQVFTTAGSFDVGVRVIDKNLQSVTATHAVRITGYWRSEVGPAFPFARTGAAAVNDGGTLYVLGGQPYSADGAMDARSDYLPSGGEAWIQGAFLSSNISGQGAGVDSLGRIIVFGGFELGHGQAGDAYVYDVNLGKTQGIAPRSGSPWGFAYATDDRGFIYAAGGEQLSIYPGAGDPNTTTLERYNAGTDTWEQLASLPLPRGHAAAVYDGAGHILVIAGSQTRQGQPTTTILTYDIASNTWLDDPDNQRYYMPSLPVALNGPQATLGADGMVYITGGSTTAINYSGSTSTTYVLDPQTRALVSGPALNNAHAYHASVLGDDGYVYVIGGSTTPNGIGGVGAVDKINTFATAAPEYLSAPQQFAVVGEAYDAGAFFKANPRPTFTLVNGPAGMSVDPQTGVLQWTPTIDQIGLQSVTLQATNEFGTTEPTFEIDTLALAPDVHAPTAPTNLHQTNAAADAITFRWDAASDDRGVDHYKLYRWVYVTRFFKHWSVAADNIVGTEFTLTPAVSGKYRLTAVDAAGNEGPSSASVVATVGVPPSTDILVRSATATGSDTLDVTYEIIGDVTGGFVVGFYRSQDALAQTTDELLGTVAFDQAADLTPGIHTVTLSIGSAAGMVNLPGVGVAETDTDYYLIAIADPADDIVEADSDAIGEDNSIAVSGVYHVTGGEVFVQGTDTVDSITVDSRGVVSVSIGGLASTYPRADVSGFRIRAHDGNDTINAKRSHQVVWAWSGGGNDTVHGSPGGDFIDGQAGKDKLYGRNGDDTILGGAGNDWLVGGNGRDNLDGGADNDSLQGQAGDDTIAGGAGVDIWYLDGTDVDELITVSHDAATGELIGQRSDPAGLQETDTAVSIERITVRARGGNDIVDLTAITDTVFNAVGLSKNILDGGTGDDQLLGSGGYDILYGRDGHDQLYGGLGNDLLRGGNGNDFLDGGLGHDRLLGDAGLDRIAVQATVGDDDLDAVFKTATKLQVLRRSPAAAKVLERDTIFNDLDDLLDIFALGGDDTIDVDPAITIGGSIDGGAGSDTATAPASWTILNTNP